MGVRSGSLAFALVLSGLALGGRAPAAEVQLPRPTTSAEPIPVIGRVHSSAFCSSLRESIAPALATAMRNDELIAQSHYSFANMLRDEVMTTLPEPEFSGAVDLGRMRLGRVIRNLASNLHVLHVILSDDKGYPKSASTEDNELAAELRERLKNLAVRQSDALNFVSGVVETELNEEMGAQIDTNMKASTAVSSSARSALSTGSDDLYNSDVLGHRRYDYVLEEIGREQTSIAALESALTPDVVASAKECTPSHTQSPSPAP